MRRLLFPALSFVVQCTDLFLPRQPPTYSSSFRPSLSLPMVSFLFVAVFCSSVVRDLGFIQDQPRPPLKSCPPTTLSLSLPKPSVLSMQLSCITLGRREPPS